MTLERWEPSEPFGNYLTSSRKEHWNRLSQVDWPKRAATLRAENGIWPDEETGVTWRLDGSEGPLRMR